MSSNAHRAGRSGGAAARPRARSTADRARRRRQGALAVIGIGGSALGLWFLATGPLLSLRNVEVRGDFPGDASALEVDIERAAAQGTIVQPPVGAIRRAAVTHPWVADVSVSRDLPLGVVVRVTPARPAAVATDGEAGVLVDSDGQVLGPAAPRAGLPRIVLADAPPSPGQTLPAENRAAVTFAAAAEPEVGRRVRALRMRDGRLTGRVAGGPELRLGAPDGLAVKAVALAAVLSALSPEEEKAATYVDLSVAERPAVGGLPAAVLADDEVTDEAGVDP